MIQRNNLFLKSESFNVSFEEFYFSLIFQKREEEKLKKKRQQEEEKMVKRKKREEEKLEKELAKEKLKAEKKVLNLFFNKLHPVANNYSPNTLMELIIGY